MLNEKLQAAIDKAATLSPEAQEALAAQIESWLADARWDALLETPESHAFLEELIQDARNGPTAPCKWDALLEDPRGDAFVAELFEQAQKGSFRPFPTPADMGDKAEGIG
jgi:hypothetical protein